MDYQSHLHLQRQKAREEQKERELPIYLMNEQHELNRELLREQHKFNLEIHKKQSRLVMFSIGATIVAAILGAWLGAYATTKLQAQLPQGPPLSPKQATQLQNEPLISGGIYLGKKDDKSPYIPPNKELIKKK